MKRIHVLKTTARPSDFSELFTALRELGLRGGWLDYEEHGDAPSGLEAAAAAGALRAVGVGRHRVLTVKPIAGAAVLRDLLREHFAGCRVVIVRGTIEAPVIEPAKAGWAIREEGGAERPWTSRGLAEALRKPRLPGSSGDSR